jgi:nitrogen fixation protein NifT
MKVMLHKNDLGHLSVYVPKKDTTEGKVLTLANGWQLSFTNLTDDMKLPQTLNAKRLQ